MVGVVAAAAALELLFVWLPAAVSVALSFTSWNGIGSPLDAQFVGLDNYALLAGTYPPFWPAVLHNLAWLAALLFVATPLGIAFALALEREIRGRRFYQSALFLPVVLSAALVGIIWELQYAPDQGLINELLGRTGAGAGGGSGPPIDWLGNPDLNLWAVLVAACWRHVGYVMVLYLAGLRALDPALREAAQLDGASELQTFRHVTFPVLLPVNVVILVITILEALRAFDLVHVINRGLNGLELLAVLVTNNIVGEASRIGFGSAIATVLLALCVVPIGIFLVRFGRADEGWR